MDDCKAAQRTRRRAAALRHWSFKTKMLCNFRGAGYYYQWLVLFVHASSDDGVSCILNTAFVLLLAHRLWRTAASDAKHATPGARHCEYLAAPRSCVAP